MDDRATLYRRVDGQGPWLNPVTPAPRRTGPRIAVLVGVIIGLSAFVAAFAAPAPAAFVPGPGFDICTERGC